MRTGFRRCKEDDFRSNGINADQLGVNTINQRICPDIEKLKDDLHLKNGYANRKDRISFVFEAIKCHSKYDSSCKDDHETQELLD